MLFSKKLEEKTKGEIIGAQLIRIKPNIVLTTQS